MEDFCTAADYRERISELKKANEAAKLALMRIWMTVDTSQSCSPGNEAIACWAQDGLKALGVDDQDFIGIGKIINEADKNTVNNFGNTGNERIRCGGRLGNAKTIKQCILVKGHDGNCRF